MSNEDHSVCDSCSVSIGPDEDFHLVEIFAGIDWDDRLTFCLNCKPEIVES